MRPNLFFALTMLLSLIHAQGHAQSSLTSVLEEIERNNQSIASGMLQMEADKLSYRTGNAPDDLRLGYDFLKGGAGSGDQTEILVAQAFDFPTVYVRRKQLADVRSEATDHVLATEVNKVRTTATTICLRVVHERKQQQLLEKKREATRTILSNYEELLRQGSATKLDVGKARLQLIGLDRRLAESRTQQVALLAELQRLNGGKPLSFIDTVYPLWAVPDPDSLKARWEQHDPVMHLIGQRSSIADKEVALSKAMWLPKFEAGFRHVSGFGQLFNGVHTGVTLPIWERRNTVKTKQAERSALLLNAETYTTARSVELTKLLDQEALLRQTVREYQEALASIRNLQLLETALELGHISVTEFFIEANIYYDALDTMLLTELEHQLVQADMNRYN